MITTISIILLILAIFYSIILIKIIRGFLKLKTGKQTNQPFVSVIVAARNEEKNIASCLNSLIAQKYSDDQFEIIVVNDRSEDRTEKITRRFTEVHSHVRLVNITEVNSHIASKKWALDRGIRQAKGEIILTTDADCIAQPGWISTMVSHFEDNVGLVAGYSPLILESSSTFFHKFIALEALALAGVIGGSFGSGFPLTCSGRNLAYRKSIYYQVGGFKSIGKFISGDDDLFLHLIQNKTNWKFRFAIHPESIVPSKPAATFNEFFNQRTRHASKGLYYKISMKIGLIAVYLFNLLLVVSIFIPKIWLLLFFVFGLKSFFEFILIFKVAQKFYQKRLIRVFPLTMFVHPIYVVIFGLWGQVGKFKWKGKSFSPIVDK